MGKEPSEAFSLTSFSSSLNEEPTFDSGWEVKALMNSWRPEAQLGVFGNNHTASASAYTSVYVFSV